MSFLNRRDLLKAVGYGSSVMAFGGAVPDFLQRAAAARTDPQRILVVVEMAGGNDGLNCIIPHSDPAYRKGRPQLGIARQDTLTVEEDFGLHPALRGFANLLEKGHFAAVQGVGYENPNRSHFESMDIWHSCQRKDATRTDGWLGRYLEASGKQQGTDPPGIHLGGEKQPFALMSRDVRVPSIESLGGFHLDGTDQPEFRKAIQELAEEPTGDASDLLGFVQASTTSALATSERMGSAGLHYKPSLSYPQSGLGKKLETVAKLIASDFQTGLYYVRLDGFDTHANQPAAHAALLREVGDAVSVFLNDQIAHGDGDRILVMGFSEFGRRVAENASDGTDHGTAGPMFLAGTMIKPGLIGDHPPLDDLENGDLKFHTDFRQVYATILQQWLQVPSHEILKGNFVPIPLFA